ncbi:MAG: hypothetical protein IJL17_01060 [Kiritimatiellae bacterium]|nr:hypothetical protein [Kiritimatiellia bacterium]
MGVQQRCLNGWSGRKKTLFMFLSVLSVGIIALVSSAQTLEEGFLNPPKANRPQVWWWFDATAPDAAITRDLEGLKRVGVSGFHIYGGSVTGKGWMPRVKWALHEANRLGLDGIVMIGAAGCGHAQTDPRHAQKDLVFTVGKLEVPRRVEDAAPYRNDGRAGRPRPAVKLPKKGVKETPKNADGSPKYYWDIAVLAMPDTTNDVPLAEVRDVSCHLNRETDEFAWPDAPGGKWRILRVGYVPKVFGWMGCYIDHMSKAAFDAHWARVMTPLLEALAPDERAALKGVMCDSWEAGTVSWTDTFAEEFRRRRGYDILPWLPVKAGVRLVSGPKRARFLRDFNETVSELIAENHYAYQKEVANRHGLLSIAEAAGPHQRQGDVRRMQGRCDVAMGEFWMPSGHRPLPPQRFMVRDAANAAHVYGMGEVLAEAFTTINTYWIESPATMKPCADRAFCDGLTRVCYHGMKLSSSLTDKPGFIRNVGTHYNPQTTWFDQSDAFNLYLSRCSWMLSQGRFAADCLIYAGDAVNLFAGLKTSATGLGEGYDYDFCPTELLLQARVEDGQIVLPSGMRYRVLLLSDRNPKTNGHMRPGPMKEVKEYPPVGLSVGEAAMLKMRELVEAGATLVGPRPSGPTSMNDSSERYHAAADALWGPRGQSPNVRGQTPVGKGWVLVDRAAARAFLAAKGVGPDFSTRGLSPSLDALSPTIDWIHRILPDGTDIYFISNQKNEKISFNATFRQPKGRSVELWDAVTGQRTPMGTDPKIVGTVPGFVGTGPCMALELPAYGSIFVVFRSQQAATLPWGKRRLAASAVPGPWNVTFAPTWGGPAVPVIFDSLVDWTTRPEPGIRHYSGTATYRTTFDAPPEWKKGMSVQIDLGRVENVATVFVNGKLSGTGWTAPFAVTATNVQEKGNELEVRVTNLWPNRLIYDAGLPEAERLTRTNINPYKPTDPLLPSGLLGPVRISVIPQP